MTTYQANIFQIRLMIDIGINVDDNEKIFEWINKYAERFREVVDRGIEDYEKIRFIIYLNRIKARNPQ